MTTALRALRTTILVLYTQNELSGAILNQSIQLPIWGVKFCQKLTTFPSQHLPLGRTWSQGQTLYQGSRPWSLRNMSV